LADQLVPELKVLSSHPVIGNFQPIEAGNGLVNNCHFCQLRG